MNKWAKNAYTALTHADQATSKESCDRWIQIGQIHAMLAITAELRKLRDGQCRKDRDG